MYVPILKNRTVEVSVLQKLSELHVFDKDIIPLVEVIQERTRSNNKNTFMQDLLTLLCKVPEMKVMVDFYKSAKLRNTTDAIREFVTMSVRYPEFAVDQIRQLCAEKGIELLLVRAPIEYGWHEQWDENIEKYAAQYGLTYINFNDYADEMGIDMTHDTYDEGLHLNIYGAEKLSVFFGKYLTEKYDLTDYRTIPAVAKEYEKDIAFYNFMRDDQLSEIEKYGELMSYGANAIED